MEVRVLCPGCKESGKDTPVEVTAVAPDYLYEHGWCVLCQEELSGRALPEEPEPDVPGVVRSEPTKKAKTRVFHRDIGA
jgi:hypothetical protein